MKKKILKVTSLTIALMFLCMVGAQCTEAASEDEYIYGYTPMSFADFWYGELNAVTPCDTFDPDAPDLTAESEDYLHFSYSSSEDADPYAGVQKNTWDNDSGMYDAVTRATVGYGLFRGGFGHVVEITLDNGEKKIMSHEIVEDETAPTGYRIDLNTNGVEGIVLTDNTRLDTENTTGYTPDTKTTYAKSVENGGGGYRILGLKRVAVKVKKAVADEALRLREEGKTNPQLDAFLKQYDQIIAADTASAYACKELYANGIYGAREVNENTQAKDPGKVFLGDGSNGTKKTAHGDGYADLTMFVYYENYDGYTRGSVGSLDEATLNTIYEGEEKPTYADNKENADKLAAFMDYALNFQGAKLQWAGADNAFDTDDDVFAGEMLHKDAYFSFNHGNYIEISITNCFERFKGFGNGNYRITMYADGYRDVTVDAENLLLDYRAPVIGEEDVAAVGEDKKLSVVISTEGLKVSLDEAVQSAYTEGLKNAENYSLSYMDGQGRKAKKITVAEKASEVAADGNAITVVFDVSGAESLPEDIHYIVGIASAVESVDQTNVEFHYAPKD